MVYEILSCLNDQTGEPFKAPFSEYVSQNPSIEEMKKIVIEQNIWPKINEDFLTGEYELVIDTIKDSWDAEPAMRPTANCILFRLEEFSNKLPSNSLVSSSLATTEHSPSPHLHLPVLMAKLRVD